MSNEKVATKLADALTAVERMTFEDGVTWNLREDSAIRTHFYGDSEPCCPLTAWCRAAKGANFALNQYDIAARLLGVDYPAARLIVKCADSDFGADFDILSSLRNALLEKLGMGEPE